MNENKKVLVAMSGGVDSSVAVKLLLDKGYECAGATMHLYSNEDIGIARSKTCCSLNDVEDARFVAYKLGIDFHVFNFATQFKEWVIDNFVDTYLNGGTPNPCIECNKHLKFGSFLERARLLGYEYIATGHYVRRRFNENTGRYELLRSPYRAKDQSYVLYGMTQDQLAHTLFPVADMDKDTIRSIALENDLVNAAKPDSQDICFIPDGDYSSFITNAAGEQVHGDILLSDGTKLGEHKGLINYTVGQRKGIGVSYSEPLFVIDKRVSDNTLILGTLPELSRSSLTAGDINCISVSEIADGTRCTCQTRYHQQDVPCTLHPNDDGTVRVDFDTPHRAICRGQAVVFYDGEVVIGGGTII